MWIKFQCLFHVKGVWSMFGSPRWMFDWWILFQDYIWKFWRCPQDECTTLPYWSFNQSKQFGEDFLGPEVNTNLWYLFRSIEMLTSRRQNFIFGLLSLNQTGQHHLSSLGSSYQTKHLAFETQMKTKSKYISFLGSNASLGFNFTFLILFSSSEQKQRTWKFHSSLGSFSLQISQ